MAILAFEINFGVEGGEPIPPESKVWAAIEHYHRDPAFTQFTDVILTSSTYMWKEDKKEAYVDFLYKLKKVTGAKIHHLSFSQAKVDNHTTEDHPCDVSVKEIKPPEFKELGQHDRAVIMVHHKSRRTWLATLLNKTAQKVIQYENIEEVIAACADFNPLNPESFFQLKEEKGNTATAPASDDGAPKP